MEILQAYFYVMIGNSHLNPIASDRLITEYFTTRQHTD